MQGEFYRICCADLTVKKKEFILAIEHTGAKRGVSCLAIYFWQLFAVSSGMLLIDGIPIPMLGHRK